jgi:predicted AlkP superfamily phosphohydrolase/phosphomutase
VDSLIEKIVKNHPEACFFLVSDHGFEEIKKIFYPDNMLYNKGYLTPKQDPFSSPISQFFIFVNRFFNTILKILPKKTLKESEFLKNILFKSSTKSNLIDFSKTIAFATADGRGIQICSKKRFSGGIVEIKDYDNIRNKIKKDLLEIKDPETGEKIIENIYNFEEVYGEEAIDSPDIVFDFKKGITAAEWIKFPDKIEDIIHSKKRNIPYIFKKDTAGRTGDHSPYGIFYAYGDNIKANYEIKDISVQDVLPTIFTYMNFSKPSKVDGISKDEIFIIKPKVRDIWKSEITKKPQLKKSELSIINKLKKELK